MYRPLLFLLVFTLIFNSCASGIQRDYDQTASEMEEGALPEPRSFSGSVYKKSAMPKVAGIVQFQNNLNQPQKQISQMMVYEAALHSTVNELETAVETARSIIKKKGGFIEKQSIEKNPARAEFTFRIPVELFEETLHELSRIGTVTYRSIKAKDISREFADLSQRLKNLENLRSRLQEILKKTTETKQKIRIINEISRLNKEIDSMEARKKYLAKKATFSTIQVQFTARQKLAVHTGSPIKWIRNLRPEKRTLGDDPEFTFEPPLDFLDNRENYSSFADAIYFSPDGVKLRASTIDNEPSGDLEFYERAMKYEQSRFPDGIVDLKKEDDHFYITVNRRVGYELAYYTVAIFVDGAKLHIIEAYYPREDVYKKHNVQVSRSVEHINKRSLLQRLAEVIL